MDSECRALRASCPAPSTRCQISSQHTRTLVRGPHSHNPQVQLLGVHRISVDSYCISSGFNYSNVFKCIFLKKVIKFNSTSKPRLSFSLRHGVNRPLPVHHCEYISVTKTCLDYVIFNKYTFSPVTMLPLLILEP